MESLQEQINNYEEQISLIQAQIEEDDSEDLQQILSDLQELVALLKEEAGTEIAAPSSSDNQADDDCELDDIIGSRVLVEHPMFSKFTKYHSAIVLDIEPAKEREGFEARVLFSAPLEMAMKPCPYFLKGTCRFEKECRFSHGFNVPLEVLQDYILPDFSQVKEGSLVLIPVDSGLYEVARVAVIDKEESAVKLLKSGKEVSTLNTAMIPLNETQEEQDEETYREPNTSWNELKEPSVGNVSVGDLGQWTGGGFGLKMLQKMGYKLGQGLGKYSDGIVHSVQAKMYKKGKGLGSDQGIPASKLAKSQKKKIASASNPVGEQENEIFDFINKKLGYLPQEEKSEADQAMHRPKDTSGSSSASVVSTELEIKKMKSNERKLQEGIRRNQKDPNAVKKLGERLKALQKDIQRLERQYASMTSEQTERRQKKRDIF